jgi:hypothetical protein
MSAMGMALHAGSMYMSVDKLAQLGTVLAS